MVFASMLKVGRFSVLYTQHIYSCADDTSECLDYANAGDCRFYKCFNQRFPCNVFGTSHVSDFELPVCEDLSKQKEVFDSQVSEHKVFMSLSCSSSAVRMPDCQSRGLELECT